MILFSIVFAVSSVSALPQRFSLNIGFGSDDSPLEFFPEQKQSSLPDRSSSPSQKFNPPQQREFNQQQEFNPPQEAPIPFAQPPRAQSPLIRAPLPPRRFQDKSDNRIQTSQSSLEQKENHDSALQRNALHRQQLAEVVAKHNQRTEEEAKKVTASNEEFEKTFGDERANIVNGIRQKDTKIQRPSETRTDGIERFITSEGSPVKTSAKKSNPKTVKSTKEELSKNEIVVDQEYSETLAEHLQLISLLDQRVEALVAHARSVFDDDKQIKNNSSELESRSSPGGKLKRKRPALADPRRVSKEED